MHHIHIPTPGDHYSPATGSAVITVIYECARVHAEAGGHTDVIVGEGTNHGYPPYPVGDCLMVPFTGLPKRWQRAADHLIGVVGLGHPFTARCYAAAKRAIDRSFTGSIFVHNAPGAMTAIKRHAPSAKVYLWIHNTLFSRYRRREIERIVGACDGLICVSRFIANVLEKRLGHPSEKIHVVPNGVDVSKFRPANISKANHDPIILFLGRVQEAKGPDLLLKAAMKLLSQGLRFRVRIVGSQNFAAADPLTPYEQHLRRLAEPFGERVEFRPFVDREMVVGEYQSADIFCAPSNCDEAFGLTIAEAMACGLPVVASSRGGIPELGGTAILQCDPRNLNDLSALLGKLLNDDEARARYGRFARERALQFTWEKQYQALRESLSCPSVMY